MKVRKKPIIVEAERFMGGFSYDEMTVEWGKSFVQSVKLEDSTNILKMITLEGLIEAEIGDWIVRGIKGEFYPVKSDIFEETYDRV